MTNLTNILIVDDDAMIRSIMTGMISDFPLTIQEAENGQNALEIIKSSHIDVVISDLVMPKMSGLMLLHSMIELGIQVPFILTTGFGDKDSAIQALRLGVFDYLEKPIHEADFRSVVEEAIKVSMDQKTAMTPSGDVGILPVQKIDPRARSLVLKLKAFHAGRKKLLVPAEDILAQDTQWSVLRDLFIKETLPLAEAALNKIKGQKTQKRGDLGFCLRIAQSIRFAASALSIGPIAELAWHCEFASASLKLAPEFQSKESVQTLVNGFQELKRQIEELANPGFLRALSDLAKLQVRLKQVS